MVTDKASFVIFLSFFNLSAVFFSFLFGYSLSGLFVGSVLGMSLFCIDRSYLIFVNRVFYIFLYLNLIVLFNNLFFANYFIIPPLFSSTDETHNKTIIRAVSFLGNNYLMRRTTGLSDNIHVSSCLNLILCYILYVKKKNILYYLATGILFLSMNLQFVIIFLVWTQTRSRDLRFNFRTILVLFIFLFLIFSIVDYFILDSAYFNQIIASESGILLNDFKAYYNALNIKTILFGIKPGYIDDPFDSSSGYYLPLTDIGIIGIPIQFGVVGVCSILFISSFWLKYSKKQEKKFILPLFFSAIHYFSLASFLGVIFITWIVRYPPEAKSYLIQKLK